MLRFHSIIRVSIAVLMLASTCSVFAQAVTTSKIKDYFANMPDSLLPLMTKNNRLDCIDYIENNMRARVHNKFDEEVELEKMTDDYLLLRTSGSTYQEMKLFQLNNTTPLLCIISTTQQGDSLQRIHDSVVRFYNQNFLQLSAEQYLESPSLESFLTTAVDSACNEVKKALVSLRAYHPMHIQFSTTPLAFTFTLQVNMLATEERKALLPYLRTQEILLKK